MNQKGLRYSLAECCSSTKILLGGLLIRTCRTVLGFYIVCNSFFETIERAQAAIENLFVLLYNFRNFKLAAAAQALNENFNFAT